MQGNDFSPSDESLQTTNQYTLVVVIGKMAIRTFCQEIIETSLENCNHYQTLPFLVPQLAL
jgi:hypothetical protein